MLAYYQAVRGAATRIASAIDGSVEALRARRVEHEPAVTDRMLGAIEESLRGFTEKGIRWEAKTLTDRGRGSQESKYGADFMGVLKINLPGFRVSKGFLAQAKLVREGDAGDLDELKRQCEKMLKLSPASFVFLYSSDGVRVVPALSALSSSGSPVELYSRSAQRFFEEHLQCFVGDRSIASAHASTLDELREQFQVRTGFMLKAKAA